MNPNEAALLQTATGLIAQEEWVRQLIETFIGTDSRWAFTQDPPTEELLEEIVEDRRIIALGTYDRRIWADRVFVNEQDDIRLAYGDEWFIIKRISDLIFVTDALDFSLSSSGVGLRDVYAITIHNGNVVIRYTLVSNANAPTRYWSQRFVDSDGVSWQRGAAAIEFDGFWRDTPIGRRLITDREPWVFWINRFGELVTQQFGRRQTRYTLVAETGSPVTYVSAVRGWLYQDATTDHDVGLIVMYIRSGRAYCRRRVWVSQPDPDNPMSRGTRRWTVEQEIIFTGASFPLRSFRGARLNDFRMIMAAEDSQGRGFAVITDRYLQGDTLAPIRIRARLHLPRTEILEPWEPYLVSAELPNRVIPLTETIINCSHPVHSIADNAHTAFTMLDGHPEIPRTIITRGLRTTSNPYQLILTHDAYRLIDNGIVRITYTNTNNRFGPIRMLDDNQFSTFSPLTTILWVEVGDLVDRSEEFSENFVEVSIHTAIYITIIPELTYHSKAPLIVSAKVTTLVPPFAPFATYFSSTYGRGAIVSAAMTTIVTFVDGGAV